MRQGHFHFHTGAVSRAKGHSAVAASAYQSGQKLTHEQQLVSHREFYIDSPTPFTVSYEHRHDFKDGLISDSLRSDFAANGIALSKNAAIEKKKNGGWVIVDGENTHHFLRINVTDQLSLDHRKHLNKGRITDDLRADLRDMNIPLSARATAQKDGRRDWTISDGNRVYHIKEHEKKVFDESTGKRVTADRVLHIYADKRHNYTTREDVKETWLQAPAHAPAWVQDMEAKGNALFVGERERLWNWAESAEVAKDARPAQRFQMSFTRGLSYEQNKALLREYVAEQFTRKGLIADVAIHQKAASDRLPNQHAHVLVFTREVDENGDLVENKHRDWTNKQQVASWRRAWADKQNTALAATDSDTRVDHRSYAGRGLDIVPGEHLGPSAWSLDQRGEVTEKGQQNVAIEAENQRRDKRFSKIARRVRKPEYTKADIADYYAKQEAQLGHVDRPSTAALNAHAAQRNTEENADRRLEQAKAKAGKQLEEATTTTTKWYGLGSKTTVTDLTRIDPVGRKSAPDAADDQPSYAAQQTRVGAFGLGSKTSTTWLPGDANRPRHERAELEQRHNFRDGTRQGEWERFEQAKAYHARTLVGLIGDNQSGSSTQTIRERVGRMKEWTVQQIGDVRERWRSRSEQGSRGRDNERER